MSRGPRTPDMNSDIATLRRNVFVGVSVLFVGLAMKSVLGSGEDES